MIALLLSFATLLTTTHSYTLSCEQQVEIEKFLLNILITNEQSSDNTPGDTIADWVRLCFHDAGTWNPFTKSGGAHACLATKCSQPNQCEYTLDANAGLPPVVDALETHWINGGWQSIISRPDFWHLSCKVAVEYASGGAAKIKWGWGRTECQVPIPNFADTHPDAAGGFAEVQRVLINQLGFTWEEAIALMGAHSLGQTVRDESGFEGRWVPNPANRFTNSFYKVLLQHDWFRITDDGFGCGHHNRQNQYDTVSGNGYPTNHPQFVSDQVPGGIMLYTDISLGWDITDGVCNISAVMSRTGSAYKTHCPARKKHLAIIKRFAQDINYWYQVFAQAFEKLQNFGGDYLTYNPDAEVNTYGIKTFNRWNGYTNFYGNPFDIGFSYRNGNGICGAEYLVKKQPESRDSSSDSSSSNSGSDSQHHHSPTSAGYNPNAGYGSGYNTYGSGYST